MGDTFTKSMAALHTWAGVTIGALLFAIFWMGTLSVFSNEIDRWMMPETRLGGREAAATPSLDRIARAVLPGVPAGARQWRVDLPTARTPVMEFSYRGADGVEHGRLLDPSSYAFLPPQGSAGATGFIVPFHYHLHLNWLEIGKWLVGLAAMTMLVMLVSGVIVHKKIIAQFFTFRPRKRLQRSALDLHNLTGVLALPFHFTIALSGLIIFMTIYFPQSYYGAYGSSAKDKAAFTAEAYGRYTRKPAKAPGTLASLDAMRDRAEREWRGGQPYFVRVWNPGDANSYVELRRSYANDMTMNLDQIYFDAATGEVLERFEAGPVMTVQRFFSGLHFVRFERWTLRWLYFLGGISGCVMIATGFLFWLEGRRARHAKHGLAGVAIVEGLTIGSVTGILLATLAFFVANRLLPADAGYTGVDRAGMEIRVFHLVWVLAFCHAWWRRACAWREQLWAIAGLSVLAVGSNWATTGEHVLKALSQGQFAVAGMDLALLATALLALMAARRLKAGRIQGA